MTGFRIMVVDDTPANLTILKKILHKNGNEVYAFPSGLKALKAAQNNPPDLILLDITMPELDGYEVCKRLKQDTLLRGIPVIFLSALSSTDDKIKAFQCGGVDYITKPFQFEEVLARVETHLRLRSLQTALEYQNQNLEQLVAEKVREISESQLAAIFALAKMAENRDEDTGSHLERVREYCRLLTSRLRESSPYADQISGEFVACIHHASPLHDIGKVAIPDCILLKPGKLSAEEFETMKTHTSVGAENLQAAYNRYTGNSFIEMGIDIARHHHEWWNGTGYPAGLAGVDIPLSARIMALTDFYDALCSDRCYRKGVDHQTVKGMILSEKGTHFDPVIVDAFLAVEADFHEIMKTCV
jgi:putative two-component system response regulator